MISVHLMKILSEGFWLIVCETTEGFIFPQMLEWWSWKLSTYFPVSQLSQLSKSRLESCVLCQRQKKVGTISAWLVAESAPWFDEVRLFHRTKWEKLKPFWTRLMINTRVFARRINFNFSWGTEDCCSLFSRWFMLGYCAVDDPQHCEDFMSAQEHILQPQVAAWGNDGMKVRANILQSSELLSTTVCSSLQ